MSKRDGLSKCSRQEKSGKYEYNFNQEQLFDLENDDVGDGEDAEYMELVAINMATWETKNGLWVVPQQHRLEVLCQHHDRQVAAQWGRI